VPCVTTPHPTHPHPPPPPLPSPTPHAAPTPTPTDPHKTGAQTNTHTHTHQHTLTPVSTHRVGTHSGQTYVRMHACSPQTFLLRAKGSNWSALRSTSLTMRLCLARATRALSQSQMHLLIILVILLVIHLNIYLSILTGVSRYMPCRV
jgi:hypothetical protein